MFDTDFNLFNGVQDFISVDDTCQKYNCTESLDEFVYTCSEIKELLNNEENENLKEFLKNKFLQDATVLISNACSSVFGFVCARQRTFEIDSWDFIVDKDGNC